MEGVSSAGATADTKVLLVVDDSQTIRTAVEMVFNSTEYQVVAIASAAEAIIRTPDLQPVLLLVDADMPGVNGYELVKRLKADDRTSEIPILMMCAEHTLDREAIDEAEVDGHVTKPFRSRDLVDIVKMMTGGLVTGDGPRSFEERLELFRLEQQAKDRRSDPELRSVSQISAPARSASLLPRPDEGLELDFQLETPAERPAGRRPPPAAPPVVAPAAEPAPPPASTLLPPAPLPPPVVPAPLPVAQWLPPAPSPVAPSPVAPSPVAPSPVVPAPAPKAAAPMASNSPAELAWMEQDEPSAVETLRRPLWPKVLLLLLAVGAVAAFMLFSR